MSQSQTRPSPPGAEATSIRQDVFAALTHAIEHQLCVRTTSHRARIILAPHILYERGGELLVDGAVLERDGSWANDASLTTLKVKGLRDCVATADPVRAVSGFDRTDPRYAEGVVSAID